MSDTGSRPRPQYGEYATPEEQRQAIKAPEANPHYAPPVEHESPLPANPAAPPSAVRRPDAGALPAQQHPPQSPQAPAGPTFLRHPVDRVVTIALLVFGLYNVITTVMDRGGIAGQIDQAYHSLGLSGDYAVTALTGTVADVIAIVFGVLWIATAALSGLAIARGRIAFWIPLVAGVLASLVSGVGYLILFMHDPTFVAYLQQAT
jgi:hypothetical protein